MSVSLGTQEIKADKRPLTSEILRGRGWWCGVSMTRNPSESFPNDEGGWGGVWLHWAKEQRERFSLLACQVYRCSGYEIYHPGKRVVLQLARRKG